MKKMSVVLLVFLISAPIFSQGYKKIKLNIADQQQITVLASAGLDMDHAHFDKDNSVTLFVSDEEFQIVQSAGVPHEILINDWYEYYNSLPKMTETEMEAAIQNSIETYNVSGFGYGSMGGYYTFEEAIARLDSMYQQYPHLITQKFPIGTSHEGRTIWAVKISDNPNITENEPQAGFDALIHAREPQSMATMIYFMYYLLENYGTDPVVTYLVNNREIFFVPVLNPDGYVYNRQTNPNGGGMWRKNRRNNGGSFGVDLNRNYGYMWGYDNNGSSPTPSSETYRGPFAFSEPETQAIRDFLSPKNVQTYFNMHSWQNAYLYPWGYIDAQTPDSAAFYEFCSDMSSWNNYAFGTGSQVLGYNSNGSTRDWLYGEQTTKNKIFGYTIEIGSSSDGFWPSQSRIIPLAQINVIPNLYNVWVAGEYVSFENAVLNPQYLNPGQTIEMTPYLKNKGLAEGTNIQAQLTSLSPYITINSGSGTLSSIPPRTVQSLGQNLTFSVDASAPVETEVKMLFTTSVGGAVMSSDTLSYIVGTPEYVFIDTVNNPLVHWTVTATPGTSPKWEATTSTFYSSPASYTDSRIGQYINNATVTMQLTNPIDLSGYSNPKLSFWTKYDIESNWDYGWIRITTNNGSTWTALQGQYTEPGVGSFQPNGQPVYDGVISNWVKEEINLSSFTASNVKLQFQLRTDGTQTRDGWYLDDIAIVVYSIIPVELHTFSANPMNDRIRLTWSTASELNNEGFIIEKRSKDDLAWSRLGFVNGIGTSSESQNYFFEDINPLYGKNTYRLKQVDYDGTFRIYGPVQSDFNTISDFALEQNYPNPFNPSTSISWQMPHKEHVVLKIYDMLGREVKTLVNGIIDAGFHKAELDASGFASGTYIYTLRAGNYFSSRKMTILK